MVLCICQAVTDREVDATIHSGARSLDEVAAGCGAGTDCGCCREAIEERLRGQAERPCGRGCTDCPRALPCAA
jgi:bacterioferritin-associated ferredoxin